MPLFINLSLKIKTNLSSSLLLLAGKFINFVVVITIVNMCEQL